MFILAEGHLTWATSDSDDSRIHGFSTLMLVTHSLQEDNHAVAPEMESFIETKHVLAVMTCEFPSPWLLNIAQRDVTLTSR